MADKPGDIHHANVGRHLKRQMEALGIECIHHLDTDFPNADTALESEMAFLKKRLGVKQQAD